MSVAFIPDSNEPARRRAITARCAVAWRDSEVIVDLFDLSAEGAQISVFEGLAAGERAGLHLSGDGVYFGEVRWVLAGRAGLRFDTTLAVWQIDQVIDCLKATTK